MGVSIVVPFFQHIPDIVPQISRDAVESRVVEFGAEKVSGFTIDYDVYYPLNPSPTQQNLYLFHHSDYPLSSFSLLESGVRLTSENSFDMIMSKLKAFYQTRKNSVIEIRGTKYKYIDFLIRVGTIHFGQNIQPKHFTLEIEYLPCSAVANCKNLLLEMANIFIPGFPPEIVPLKQPIDGAGAEVFCAFDAIEQYATIIKQIKGVSFAK